MLSAGEAAKSGTGRLSPGRYGGDREPVGPGIPVEGAVSPEGTVSPEGV